MYDEGHQCFFNKMRKIRGFCRWKTQKHTQISGCTTTQSSGMRNKLETISRLSLLIKMMPLKSLKKGFNKSTWDDMRKTPNGFISKNTHSKYLSGLVKYWAGQKTDPRNLLKNLEWWKKNWEDSQKIWGCICPDRHHYK